MTAQAHGQNEAAPADEHAKREREFGSRISELVGMVEHLRAVLTAIRGEEDPKAMKSLAESGLAGVPPPEAKKKEK